MLGITQRSNKQAMFFAFAAATFVMTLAMVMLVAGHEVAFATTGGINENAKKAIEGVVTVIKLIGAIVGIIMIVQGGMKYAMAHSNDNGPEQTKAITTLAAGVVMVIFSLVVVDSLSIPDWISSIVSESTSTGGGSTPKP